MLEWFLRLPWPPPIRARWLRLFGASVGAGARIHRCHLINVDTDAGFRVLYVGEDAHIGPECLLDLAAAVHIGPRTTLAPRVVVLTHADAGHASVSARFPRIEAAAYVEADAWVGAGAVILPGNAVGEAAVVGAGAVVTEPVPPGAVVVGVPARQVGDPTT